MVISSRGTLITSIYFVMGKKCFYIGRYIPCDDTHKLRRLRWKSWWIFMFKILFDENPFVWFENNRPFLSLFSIASSPRASGIIASDAGSSVHRPHDLARLADPSHIPRQLSGLLIRSRFWNFLLLELHSPNPLSKSVKPIIVQKATVLRSSTWNRIIYLWSQDNKISVAWSYSKRETLCIET
jgi:hypothetical protein